MFRPLLVGTLGGTFAVMTGLAASAEPLAPLPSEADSASSLLSSVTGVTPVAYEAPPLGVIVGAAQPLSEPPLRPQARALAAVPVEVTVQSGAAIRPESRPVFTAAARWDGRAQAEAWSVAAMKAIEEAPRDLTEVVPADIAAWCPGYERNPPHLRAAFWVGTVSALARYESNFDPEAQGGGGAWQGLLQISPATARHYGCDADSSSELRDGEENLECAIRIMSRTVARDGVIAAGGGGIAADWGPMARQTLREQMREWVRGQSYCEVQTAVMASLIPPVRPASVVPDEVKLASLEAVPTTAID